MIVNTKSAFRIAYKESNRGYSDTLELQGCVSDAAATRERCFCGSSRSRHRRRSTNTDSLLDMTDFLPGRITFTMVNEDGRNVDFELEWREA